VLAISHLAEQAGQGAFADFGTFMLERTVKSLADPDRRPTPRIVKVFARRDERRSGKIAKLADLQARLSFDRPSTFSRVC
jgi:hypothetical protein